MTDPESGPKEPPSAAAGARPQPEQAVSSPPPQPSPYQAAEEGWEELVRAAAKVQAAANAIKKTERSVDGYNIERTLNKHKPHLMAEHLAGLREHRKTNKL